MKKITIICDICKAKDVSVGENMRKANVDFSTSGWQKGHKGADGNFYLAGFWKYDYCPECASKLTRESVSRAK